jgi:hypothetical protein
MSSRASSTTRGYGVAHRRRRKNLAPLVAAGLTSCARCGKRIEPGEPWDLGHVDGTGKRQYSGPEHRKCNRQTEWHGVKQPRTLRWSRIWYVPIPANVELMDGADEHMPPHPVEYWPY